MLSLFVFVLVYNRHELSKGIYTSGFAKAVRCLTGGYKEKYYWFVRSQAKSSPAPARPRPRSRPGPQTRWEIVEVTRRLAVCGWVVLIPANQVFYRLIFTLGTAAASQGGADLPLLICLSTTCCRVPQELAWR